MPIDESTRPARHLTALFLRFPFVAGVFAWCIATLTMAAIIFWDRAADEGPLAFASARDFWLFSAPLGVLLGLYAKLAQEAPDRRPTLVRSSWPIPSAALVRTMRIDEQRSGLFRRRVAPEIQAPLGEDTLRNGPE